MSTATLDSIIGTDLAYREALAAAERIRENRDGMIRDALERGLCSQRKIARALGLSPGRIGQIATASK